MFQRGGVLDKMSERTFEAKYGACFIKEDCGQRWLLCCLSFLLSKMCYLLV